MESKKINQLATEMAPAASDLTIIGDPITGVSKKITLLQLATTIGAGADLQQVTDNGATTTNPIAIGGLTITGLATGALLSTSGVISSVPYGAANGVATLGGDGKVPSIQLPSYVDDVVEVANFAALPVTGETGKLYVTLDNNKVYRWTGSIYVEIAANNAVWGAITGTLSNQTDLQSALNARVPYTGATSNVDLGIRTLTANTLKTTGNQPLLIDGDGGSNNGGIAIRHATTQNLKGANYTNINASGTTALTVNHGIASFQNKTYKIEASGLTDEILRTFTLPDASGTLALTSDIPSLTGYVPYTGATTNVNLGTFDLTADVITAETGSFASSGGIDTFAINHSSGSGIALNITKGGNGEGLYINKTSGSGNAATIIGTLNATTLVKSGGTSSEFLKADGSVDSSTYLTTSAAASTYLPLTGGTLSGQLSILRGSGTGLEVASDLVVFRASTGFGSPRQITLAAGNGTTTYLEAKGYGANYITDFGIRTYNASGTAFEVFFATSAGNVGIGNTAPAAKLDVNGTIKGIGITSTANEAFVVNPSSGASYIRYKIGSTSYSLTGVAGNVDDIINNSAVGDLCIRNSQRMLFSTNAGDSAAMTITSNGNVGIGITNPSRKFVVAASTAGSVAEIYNERNNSSGDFCFVTALGSNANNTNSYHYIATTGGADKFYVYGNGTYTTVSDRRLKKNISKVTDTYLDKVLALNIVNYNWNEQEDGHPLEFGMIAQEVEELIPSIVHEGREQKDGNIYKGIQSSVLPYILIKAIQEQQAQIEELKAMILSKN
jgi:hypothetical protein